MNRKVILGIDGGGSYTRVAAVDEQGRLIAHVKYHGAASMRKDVNAARNVHCAIAQTLDKAGIAADDVLGLAAGVAGYDSDADLSWVQTLTDMEGLVCPKIHVNDSVAAHAGALLGKPGIIAISGTGSNILGRTESGQYIFNGNFDHYANTAARYLVFNFVYRLLAGEADSTDDEVVCQLLEHLDMADLRSLAEFGAEGFGADRQKRSLLFGTFCPKLTEAAQRGSHLAQAVCEQGAAELDMGIKLIGSCFEGDEIPVAFIGSVINSQAIQGPLLKRLDDSGCQRKRYFLTEPALPPELGAVVLALSELHIPLTESIIDNLKKSAAAM